MSNFLIQSEKRVPVYDTFWSTGPDLTRSVRLDFTKQLIVP